MDFDKKILTLLAIFVVVVSAGIAFAADDGGYAGSNYWDMNGVSGSQYYLYNDANNTVLEPGAGLPLENQTGYVPLNTTGNGTGNVTGNATHSVSANATVAHTNATNATSVHEMPLTGNPIVVLLVVCAVIGGAFVTRRRK